jgi:hypothetical protein
MSELFTTVVFATSPFILAALLVWWVYIIHVRVTSVMRDIAQNNQAIIQAFSQLNARVDAATGTKADGAPSQAS